MTQQSSPDSATLADDIENFENVTLWVNDGDWSDSRRLSTDEHDLVVAALRSHNAATTALDQCPYAIDGCVLENSEIGPCLCANPVHGVAQPSGETEQHLREENLRSLLREARLYVSEAYCNEDNEVQSHSKSLMGDIDQALSISSTPSQTGTDTHTRPQGNTP